MEEKKNRSIGRILFKTRRETAHLADEQVSRTRHRFVFFSRYNMTHNLSIKKKLETFTSYRRGEQLHRVTKHVIGGRDFFAL